MAIPEGKTCFYRKCTRKDCLDSCFVCPRSHFHYSTKIVSHRLNIIVCFSFEFSKLAGGGSVPKSIESQHARVPRKGSGYDHTRYAKRFVCHGQGREGSDLVHGNSSERTHQAAQTNEGKVRCNPETDVVMNSW